jgi:hypothetical protein
MHLAGSIQESGGGTDWTLVAVVATAIFTGITAVIAWFGYQAGRAATGIHKPVVAKRVRSSWSERVSHVWIRPKGIPVERLGGLPIRLVNRSNRLQVVTVLADRTRLWFHKPVVVHAQHADVKAHENETLKITLEATTPWSERKRRWCTITFETGEGEIFRFRGRALVVPLAGVS